MTLPFNPQPKSKATSKARTKPNQRMKGNISAKVRQEVKNRSEDVCEVQRPYICSHFAAEMAHITGRKQLNHVTTAKDILHACIPCHRWLDGTPEGIKYKRSLKGE